MRYSITTPNLDEGVFCVCSGIGGRPTSCKNDFWKVGGINTYHFNERFEKAA